MCLFIMSAGAVHGSDRGASKRSNLENQQQFWPHVGQFSRGMIRCHDDQHWMLYRLLVRYFA